MYISALPTMMKPIWIYKTTKSNIYSWNLGFFAYQWSSISFNLTTISDGDPKIFRRRTKHRTNAFTFINGHQISSTSRITQTILRFRYSIRRYSWEICFIRERSYIAECYWVSFCVVASSGICTVGWFINTENFWVCAGFCFAFKAKGKFFLNIRLIFKSSKRL